MYYRYNRPYYINNMYNPAFTNPNLNTKTQNENIKDNTNDIVENIEDTKDSQSNNTTNLNKDNVSTNKRHRLGPIEYNSERLSIFGFSIAIDDLLILGLILILLFESDCDYALIIVLGLMFFNINLGSLNLSNIF